MWLHPKTRLTSIQTNMFQLIYIFLSLPTTIQISAKNRWPPPDHPPQERILPRGQNVSADLRVCRSIEGPLGGCPACTGPPGAPMRLHRTLPTHPDLLGPVKRVSGCTLGLPSQPPDYPVLRSSAPLNTLVLTVSTPTPALLRSHVSRTLSCTFSLANQVNRI